MHYYSYCIITVIIVLFISLLGHNCSPLVRAASFLSFLDHRQYHATVGRTPLDEGSARRGDYMTTHNTQKRETSMLPAGFEPAFPAGLRPLGHWDYLCCLISSCYCCVVVFSVPIQHSYHGVAMHCT